MHHKFEPVNFWTSRGTCKFYQPRSEITGGIVLQSGGLQASPSDTNNSFSFAYARGVARCRVTTKPTNASDGTPRSSKVPLMEVPLLRGASTSCCSNFFMTSILSENTSQPAAAGVHPPHTSEHCAVTSSCAASQGLTSFWVSCVLAHTMRAPHVAFLPSCRQTLSHGFVVVCVDVRVTVVAVTVEVDGQPFCSCLQHHSFQSGVHNCSHAQSSALQSYACNEATLPDARTEKAATAKHGIADAAILLAEALEAWPVPKWFEPKWL